MEIKRGFFKKLWEGWKRIAAKIAHVQGHLLLSLIYLLVVAPVAVLFKLFGQDVLALRLSKAKPSYWIQRDPMSSIRVFLKRAY